jgi:hypothetical protein
MLPPRLRKSPRILLITLCVTFVAGAQFTAVLLIFPTQSYNQFGQDPVAVGIRGSVIGFSLLVGEFVTAFSRTLGLSDVRSQGLLWFSGYCTL